jgi:hypothetical protein
MEEKRNNAGVSANRAGRRRDCRNCRFGVRSNFGVHVRPKHNTGSGHDSRNGGTHDTDSARYRITDAGHSHAGSGSG